MTTVLAQTARGRHARDPHPQGRLLGRGVDLLLVVVAVAVHLRVQWLVRPAPHWGDASDVYDFARSWPDVGSTPNHHAMRIGSLLPARLAIDWFGPGQWAFYAWPVVTGALLVAATYVLARLLGGRAVAVAATVAVVALPALVETSSGAVLTSWQLLPDVPCAALLTTTYAALAAASRTRRQAPWLVLAGLALGWAYLCREYAVLAFPAVLGALIALGIPWRRWLWGVVPVLACFGLELWNDQRAYGKPLARWTEAAGHGSDGGGATTRADAWRGFADAMTTVPRGTTVVVLTVLAVAGPVLLHRQRRVALAPALHVACFWLGLTLLGGVLHPATPSLRIGILRYWLPLVPLALVGGALVLVSTVRWLVSWLPRPAARVVVAAAVVGALAWYAVPASDDVSSTTSEDVSWSRLRTWLHDEEPDGVLLECRAARVLGTYYRYEPRGGATAFDSRVRALGHDYTSPTTASQLKQQCFRSYVLASAFPGFDVLVITPTGPTGQNGVPFSDAQLQEKGWTRAWRQAPLDVWVATGSALAQRLRLQP
ncbi:dolichyl-phosphate-mannose-protein mannosyltransferase [Motilibacter rhizosphaerae]|uniref:Dolichyl-phosphate-mannose-protein mannosyltransferase n=1 Tax=Motilibacter rhizosphaerae TaxID=598652 RepID=A0A4Q7NST9_9ACTN|nr:glycosyltransferase family 39 protein [Motilibacter rhizosphaerae]RZS90213.1 dolichyl-phosphate-mannose-protein mannosyltransferase [Motilibacter rhizosphaerae]